MVKHKTSRQNGCPIFQMTHHSSLFPLVLFAISKAIGLKIRAEFPNTFRPVNTNMLGDDPGRLCLLI